MVEGPGATRNGRKISRILGHVVTTAEFPNVPHLNADTVTGLHLTDCFSVGKELFLVFGSKGDVEGEDEMALRLHFGMNGCLYVESVGRASSSVPQWRRNEEPSMRLFVRPSGINNEDFKGKGNASAAAMSTQPLEYSANNTTSSGTKRKHPESPQIPSTSNDTPSPTLLVETRSTTIAGPISASVARQKYFRLSTHDPCSPTFNAMHVFEKIREVSASDPGLMISDAILNQEIFPGVGNIIKIEALHRANVDPRRTAPSLSDDEMHKLIECCHEFSLSWLRNGHTPNRLVYNKTICGTCNNASVSMQKLGGGTGNAPASLDKNKAFMARVTFWCTICQPSGATSSASPSVQRPRTEERVFSCPEHGPRQVILRRVKKTDSTNFLRLFRTCKQRGCRYFVWADGAFPLCPCGKKSILRLSKTERSGGRWFFCCGGNGWGRAENGKNSNSSRNGCGLFQWANEDQLCQLGPGLTPLL